MSRDSAPLTILVVSHTHWDREWYHSAARFRQRLVPLVDELLARPPDEAPFLLDGQSIIIEDYLAVRPEARETLAAALRAGRIEAGPWYVLADELIPSGEALVRNLLAGRRLLAQVAGSDPPPVLYSPDAFGHPAALPLLASEFGYPLIITWRGLGGPLWPQGDSFRWEAPDGSSALVHHLPPDGYEFGSNLPASADGAAGRWRALDESVVPRSRMGVILVMNGADHHAPQRDLPRAIAALARAAAPAVVRRVGLRAAAEALTSRADAHDLPVIRGELRASFGYTWSLQGTLGVRAPLKRRAARLERALSRDVEPWLALAARRAAVPSRVVEHSAWASLLRCHPHDTLCGCSIDAVARAMAARLDDGEAESVGLRSDALHALLEHDPDAAAGRRERWRAAVIVRNRAPRVRSGVAELELLDFVRDVPVGPGSAFAQPPESPELLLALNGGEISYQLLDTDERIDRLEPKRRYPDADLVRVRRVVAWLSDVPAYGVMPIPITAGASAPPTEMAVGRQEPDGTLTIGNERVRVTYARDGGLSLQLQDDGRVVTCMLELEDTGDAGDTYTPSLIGPTVRASVARDATLIHAGPLRAEMRLAFVLTVPEQTARAGRSGSTVEMPVEISVIVDARDPFVRLRVRGTNTAYDHRVRMVIDGGVGPGATWADAAFGPVQRASLVVPPELTRQEHPLPTAPLHRYVTVATDRDGFTVFADGLTEYETLEDGRVAVTVFRGVGALSRPDLPERPGHAGWPADTPEAQCLGPFEAELAVMLHGPRTDEEVDRIERAADDVLLPLTGHTVRSLLHVPPAVGGPELEGQGLAFGACKRSEDGEWMVLRCINLLDRQVEGRWRLPHAPVEVRRSTLDERPKQPLASDGRDISFRAPPRGVVTVLVR